MRVESVDQRGAALAITLTHSPDVANEVAAFDEIAKDQLRQDCRAASIQSLHTGERVDQRRGNDEVADAQRREQRLVETAGVQDASASTHPIQGWVEADASCTPAVSTRRCSRRCASATSSFPRRWSTRSPVCRLWMDAARQSWRNWSFAISSKAATSFATSGEWVSVIASAAPR